MIDDDTDPEDLTEEELRAMAIIDGRRYRTIGAGHNATKKRPK
ncbi:MAG: hypothetical protein U5K37_08720 [Natrialbaceae archaeon]|nr:hypothetical protein [Natrialbaceae archaeon]